MEPLKPDSILQFCEAVTVSVFFILLYLTAVKKGIEQLKSLTILLIVVLVTATRLYFIGQVQICRLLPTTSAVDLDLFMGICLLAVWTAGNYWKDNRKYFVLLYITWGLFFMISLTIILQNLNLYIRWTPPAPIAETGSSDKLDLDAILGAHIVSRETYLINAIKPAIWSIFCVIVLLKTHKEQRRAEA